MLEELYKICYGVIVPSYAEGFGLPLIEAAKYGKPILAREIPVFKEVAQGDVTFFGENNRDLVEFTRDWFYAKNKAKRESWLPNVNTWHDSASIILHHLNNQKINKTS